MRMRGLILTTLCLLVAGPIYAQTTPPAVDAGPAIAGNSDPMMPAKHKKKHSKKSMKHMKTKKMM